MSRHQPVHHKLGGSDGLSLLEIILAVTIVVISLTALVTIAKALFCKALISVASSLAALVNF